MSSSNNNSDPAVSVAEALGIDVESACALPDYDPQAEHPPAVVRARLRGPYKKRAAVDALLEPLRADAQAGVPDELLGRRVGLTKGVVRQWRRREHIDGRRRASAAVGTRFQLDAMLSRDAGAVVHLVAASPVHGRWRPPPYVLRQPLDYDAFVVVIAAAVEQFSTAELAGALGFEERDVLDAVVLHGARRAS